MIRKTQIFIVILLLLSSCIAKFIPAVDEEKELLVVQGLIHDQPETDTIKLSKSLPLGQISAARPVSGCIVKISDDQGNIYTLKEYKAGTYITDPEIFKGVIGRFYTLKIRTNTSNNNLNYESYPVELKPVPPIDSIYFEKIVIEQTYENFAGVNGCQIYLDTHDPENVCRFYRWDFSETWELRLPYSVPNQTCWISERSQNINIKSTAAFNEARITRFPINYISNVTDRLKTKYSILANQYSLNEDEYNYWEKIQNVAVQVGGLYDIIPASIASNIRCIENPEEKVLGYFSVSAKSSKRIFIQDNFAGIINPYSNCVTDTIQTDNPPGLNITVWILLAHVCSFPCIPWYEATTHKECSDCTLRGTNLKPEFWTDDKY
jgi:Domain of unknown function (DUF4249)